MHRSARRWNLPTSGRGLRCPFLAVTFTFENSAMLAAGRACSRNIQGMQSRLIAGWLPCSGTKNCPSNSRAAPRCAAGRGFPSCPKIDDFRPVFPIRNLARIRAESMTYADRKIQLFGGLADQDLLITLNEESGNRASYKPRRAAFGSSAIPTQRPRLARPGGAYMQPGRISVMRQHRPRFRVSSRYV
jgi:hypothetical protein